jgi:hypothetical protein
MNATASQFSTLIYCNVMQVTWRISTSNHSQTRLKLISLWQLKLFALGMGFLNLGCI